MRSRREEAFCAVVKSDEESESSVDDVCGDDEDSVDDVEDDGRSVDGREGGRGGGEGVKRGTGRGPAVNNIPSVIF